MPWGRYPTKVSDFRKWADGHIKNATLSESATPHGNSISSQKAKRRRRRRRKKKKNAQD